MPTFRKRTSDINILSWTAIQLRGSSQLSDAVAPDDPSGDDTEPFLVFERGIWKYPTAAATGAFVIPENTRNSRPVRLLGVFANLGASTAWTLHIAGPADNTTGTPYDAGDAAEYNEGDIEIANGTAQYLALNLDPLVAEPAGLLFPGQRVYMTTATASSPLVRYIFSPAYDSKG